MGRFVKEQMRTVLVPASLFLLVIQVSCVSGRGGDPGHAPIELGWNVECGVCGAPVGDRWKFQSQVIMGNGLVVAFDSNREMFGYLQTVNTLGYSRSQGTGSGPVAGWVRGFESESWVEIRDAWYVFGSRVPGPLGKEIIAFGDRDAAERFKAVNGGEVFGFKDIDRRKLMGLKGEPIAIGNVLHLK